MRTQINERIHAELQVRGIVKNDDRIIRTLVPRQDLTGADRTWAVRCEVRDVLRYSRASKETGIGRGQHAQVHSIDDAANRLTVKLGDGTECTYDPRRQRGVSVFREEIRRFSVGDRIQFTAPANELKIANRELGIIAGILGMALGFVGMRALLAVSPAGLPRIGEDGSAVSIDWRVLGFTLAVSLLTGILFGLLPAFSASHSDLNTTLKESGNCSGTGFREGKARSLLVVSEISLALVLLIGTAHPNIHRPPPRQCGLRLSQRSDNGDVAQWPTTRIRPA